ncbi:MAG: lipoyl domain-containing protein [Planctomycetes bacterium]|nr:lipoyl domain-containing protein [Planctomycetota bacterium]
MAEFEVHLPDLKEASGDDEAGNLAKVSFVYVSDGDPVSEGDALIEMLTDKATFDVPSPKNGVIKSIAVQEDDPVEVDDLLCVIEINE